MRVFRSRWNTAASTALDPFFRRGEDVKSSDSAIHKKMFITHRWLFLFKEANWKRTHTHVHTLNRKVYIQTGFIKKTKETQITLENQTRTKTWCLFLTEQTNRSPTRISAKRPVSAGWILPQSRWPPYPGTGSQGGTEKKHIHVLCFDKGIQWYSHGWICMYILTTCGTTVWYI